MYLLPFPPDCRIGLLKRRYKRFFVDFTMDGAEYVAHTNNSGSMLGLLREGNPILLSPACTPGRKLPYTLELVLLHAECGIVPANPDFPDKGYWVGVNTMTPNRLLRAAFYAGQLPWAVGYTQFRAEAKRGLSRLDALLTGNGLPPLWVECKNVTMVEDDVACFPDAVTTRGQKHVREMMDIVSRGERAAFFYCVQRPDASCFGPADYIDSAYANLYYQALAAGVEVHAHHVPVAASGIGLGPELPLVRLSG